PAQAGNAEDSVQALFRFASKMFAFWTWEQRGPRKAGRLAARDVRGLTRCGNRDGNGAIIRRLWSERSRRRGQAWHTRTRVSNTSLFSRRYYSTASTMILIGVAM